MTTLDASLKAHSRNGSSGSAERSDNVSIGSSAIARLRPRALRCKLCGAGFAAAPTAVCEECLGPLEAVDPDPSTLPTRAEISRRPHSIWRYKEWLPFDGEATLSLDTGFTPLVDAPGIARRLGVARCWIKNDSVSHPSLSFKDRVVATAINAAHSLRPRHSWLCFHRKPCQLGCSAGGTSGIGVVDLHPGFARARQDRGDSDICTAPRACPRQLR